MRLRLGSLPGLILCGRDVILLLLLLLLAGGAGAEELTKPDETPELEEILYITRQAEPPARLRHSRTRMPRTGNKANNHPGRRKCNSLIAPPPAARR